MIGSSARVLRAALLALATLGAAMGAAELLPAQVLRVELRDSSSGAAVAGALVTASDSSGQRRVDGLSNDRGVVTLRLTAPGLWYISIRRIGITPRRLPALRLAAGELRTLPLAMTGARMQLSRVRVTADAGVCGRAPAGDDRTAMLWEQVTLALRASTLSREGDAASRRALRVEERVRELTPELTQVSTTVTKSGFGAGRPYAAADPDSLASLGYVRAETSNEFSYFAPDEVVLLSEAFLRTHCFETPKQDQDPTLAELRFRPVRGRTVSDVEGTAFVDTLSGELRRIDFRFVASRSVMPVTAPHAGGTVMLRRFENGQWIVSRWAIRMPLFTQGIGMARYVLRGYREIGGTVDPIDEITP